jgi:hypothetical protein
MKNLVLILLACLFCQTLRAGEDLPYLVALDFDSAFDGGKLGKKTGQMFRAKAARKKIFSVDIEIDWDEKAGNMKLPGDEEDLENVAKGAADKFGCDILVWGRIERAEPPQADTVKHHGDSHDTRVRNATGLRLYVKAMNFRKSKAALAVDEIYDCDINYEVTEKIEEVLKLLSGAETPADIAAKDPANFMLPLEPDLCIGGSMDVSYDTDLKENELVPNFPEWHFPFTEGVRLVLEKLTPEARQRHPFFATHNGFLRFELSEEVAAGKGLYAYSPYIKIKPGKYYQVSFKVKTLGPKVIMFVKGYRDIPVEGYEGVVVHRQETSKHQVRFYGEEGTWGELVSKPFLPHSAKPEHMPEYLRVQLYAYWPKGTVYFDEVKVFECADKRETRKAENEGGN